MGHGCVERSGPPVSNLNLNGKKKEKRRKITFSPIFGNGHELERENERNSFSLRSTETGGQNPSSKDLKFIYLIRAMCGYRQHAISSKILCLEKKS